MQRFQIKILREKELVRLLAACQRLSCLEHYAVNAGLDYESELLFAVFFIFCLLRELHVRALSLAKLKLHTVHREAALNIAQRVVRRVKDVVVYDSLLDKTGISLLHDVHLLNLDEQRSDNELPIICLQNCA